MPENIPDLKSALSTTDGDSFLRSKYGLNAIQPTLLWKVEFLGDAKFDIDVDLSQEVSFTDSVKVPGETITVTSINQNYWMDIPYPVAEQRNTSNSFSVGFYVNIYSTVERLIIPWIKKVAVNGNISASTPKLTVRLIGYSMGAFSVIGSDFGMRPYLILYTFKNCFPTSLAEYTYDQKNMAWGNVRNVDFSYTDYEVKFNDFFSYSDYFRDTSKGWFEDPKDNKDINNSMQAEPAYERFHYSNKDLINRDTPNHKRLTDIGKNSKFKPQHNPDDNEVAEPMEAITELIGDMDKNDDSVHGTYLTEIVGNRAHFGQNSRWINRPVGEDERFVEPVLANGQKKDLEIGKNQDATNQSLKKESLLATVVKTAVKKFLMPDSPVFNPGHGATWRPEFMDRISEGIRSIQEVFYTEPLIKKADGMDFTDYSGSAARLAAGSALAVNPDEDDHPTEMNHGDPSVILIDPNDHAVHLADYNPSLVSIDPNDYTHALQHGDPNVVPVDPNDHTIDTNHNKGRQLAIDPNDHTTDVSHNDGNRVSVDPNDHTTQTNHGDPNQIPVDPNDHTTDTSHDDGNQVPVDPNDYPTSDNLKDNSVEVPTNDYVIAANLKYDKSTQPTNDAIIEHEPVGNLKQVDKNDYPSLSTNNRPNRLRTLYDVGDSTKTGEYIPVASNPNLIIWSDSSKDTVSMDDLRNVSLIRSNPNDVASKTAVEDFAVLEKMPSNDVPDLSKLNEIIERIGQNDTPNASTVKYDEVVPDRNDAFNSFVDVGAELAHPNDNDSTINGNEVRRLVHPSPNDSPDVTKISVDGRKIEPSIMDFAKMFVDERRSAGTSDAARASDVSINEKRPEATGVVSEGLSINMVERPDESQTVDVLRMNNVKIVDINGADHTEIIKK